MVVLVVLEVVRVSLTDVVVREVPDVVTVVFVGVGSCCWCCFK